MAQLLGRGQITLAVLHSGKSMQLLLSCGTPATQFFSRRTKSYVPDYTVQHVVIFPELYFSGTADNQIANVSDMKWTINGGNPIEYGGSALSHAPYSMTINKNMVSSPQLDIRFQCTVTDPDTKLKSKMSADICFTKQETENFTPALRLETPDGILFKNENPKTLKAVCRLFMGSHEVKDRITYSWFELRGKEYVRLEDTAWICGQGTQELTVAFDYIKEKNTFKCEVKFEGTTYSEFVEFARQTDPYILKIENKTGDKMRNGQGVIECEAHLYRSGKMVPDELVDKLFDFKWKKFNKNTGREDTGWRKPVARKIQLNKNDVDRLSTFTCEVAGKSSLAFTYKLPFTLT